ncbi:MAG: hypothetical protein GX752_04530 [Clostridium sp.]|nr:hypothetical protein [Clostridium sp.]
MSLLKTRKVQDFYYYTEKKEINMVTVPYRGIEPVENLVVKTIMEKGRVLYVTGETKESALISLRLKELELDYIYEKEDFDFGIHLINFNEGIKIKKEYDLLVYDDVNSFPEHTKLEAQNLVGYLYNKCTKTVAYSIEPIFNETEVIEIPLKGRSGFITEPRVIETRVNIHEAVPNFIYDYLLWFISENRKILYITQNNENKNNIIEFLLSINEKYEDIIVDIDNMDMDEIKRYAYTEEKPYIFIASTIRELLDIKVNFEIILAGADSEKYDYRKLIFLALRTGFINDINGELLLLCKTPSLDVKKAQDISRYYNRVIWDSEFGSD